MKRYSWTAAYVAAIEEHDQIELQKRIGIARTMMSERFSALINGSLSNGEIEEFRRLRDARRALDLLERVSNDQDVLEPESRNKSA
jgi:hypothetical protein